MESVEQENANNPAVSAEGTQDDRGDSGAADQSLVDLEEGLYAGSPPVDEVGTFEDVLRTGGGIFSLIIAKLTESGVWFVVGSSDDDQAFSFTATKNAIIPHATGSESGMSFSDALNVLEQGYSVTRESWNGGVSMSKQIPNSKSKMTEPYFVIRRETDHGVSLSPYSPAYQDCFAQDWLTITDG